MPDTATVFNAADDYERFMGRWSRAIGEKFLGWFGAPSGARWLDVGCGTGAFSELIAKRCEPASITGIDPSAAQVDYARKLLPAHTFDTGDSMALPYGDAAFDAVASALVIHFIPDRAKAFAEMKRVLAAGGLVGGYTWKREGLKEFAAYAPMHDGVTAVGGAVIHTEPVEESSVAGMRASLTACGLRGCRRDRDRGLANLREFRHLLGKPDRVLRARRPGGGEALRRAARAAARSLARKAGGRGRNDHVSGGRDRGQGAQAVR